MLLDSLKYNLLGHEIIRYMIEYFALKEYKSKKYDLYSKFVTDSIFDESLGNAICLIISKKGQMMYNTYSELYNQCRHHVPEVGAKALQAVPVYFPDGYTHVDFLSYCAIVTGVARHYIEIDRPEVADAIADAIASVLTTFSITNQFQDCGGMEELIATSADLVERIPRTIDVIKIVL